MEKQEIWGTGTVYQVEYETRWDRDEAGQWNLVWAQDGNRTDDLTRAERRYDTRIAVRDDRDATGRVRIVELVTTASVIRENY